MKHGDARSSGYVGLLRVSEFTGFMHIRFLELEQGFRALRAVRVLGVRLW